MVAGWIALEEACVGGRLISSGPLNDTYEALWGGERVFVRKRKVLDPQYGQGFAAERHVPHDLLARLNTPRLLDVLADADGLERYAVFEFTDGLQQWPSDTSTIDAIARSLAQIHSVTGHRMGPIGGNLEPASPTSFVSSLLETELGRLQPASGRILGHLWSWVPVAARSLDDERPRLIHGDVHKANFLRGPEGEMVVVDWEAARFRVAASDFNQLRVDWLDNEHATLVLERYCGITRRNPVLFRAQVDLLRVLWHVRTYNFETIVLGRPAAQLEHHLRVAASLARGHHEEEFH